MKIMTCCVWVWTLGGQFSIFSSYIQTVHTKSFYNSRIAGVPFASQITWTNQEMLEEMKSYILANVVTVVEVILV